MEALSRTVLTLHRACTELPHTIKLGRVPRMGLNGASLDFKGSNCIASAGFSPWLAGSHLTPSVVPCRREAGSQSQSRSITHPKPQSCWTALQVATRRSGGDRGWAAHERAITIVQTYQRCLRGARRKHLGITAGGIGTSPSPSKSCAAWNGHVVKSRAGSATPRIQRFTS